MILTKSDFFYCYNKRLYTFIKDIKGIDYIAVAKHPTTDRIYAIFHKNGQLQQAIDDYKLIKKK